MEIIPGLELYDGSKSFVVITNNTWPLGALSWARYVELFRRIVDEMPDDLRETAEKSFRLDTDKVLIAARIIRDCRTPFGLYPDDKRGLLAILLSAATHNRQPLHVRMALDNLLELITRHKTALYRFAASSDVDFRDDSADENPENLN